MQFRAPRKWHLNRGEGRDVPLRRFLPLQIMSSRGVNYLTEANVATLEPY